MGFNSGSNNSKNIITYEINSVMENVETSQHVEYLCNHHGNGNITFNPLMYWNRKMYKNPLGSRLIIASPKLALKLLSKDITAISKLPYKNCKLLFKKQNLFWGNKVLVYPK